MCYTGYMIKEWGKRFGLGLLFNLSWPLAVLAHEPYVLPVDIWQAGYEAPWYDFLAPLRNPTNAPLLAVLAGLSIAFIVGSFFFWHTPFGQRIAKALASAKYHGRGILRICVGLALVLGALGSNIFGPELQIWTIPYGWLIRYLVFALGVLLAIGWMTELAALVLAGVYLVVLWAYGSYALIYLPYLLIAVALMRYGSGPISLDYLLTKEKPKPRPLSVEPEWLRFTLAIGFLVGAVYLKVLHPATTLAVITHYELMPANPQLFAVLMTAGELGLGLLFLLGFQTRTLAIGALFMLLSAQIMFKEIVWPHLPLYGLALYALLSGGGRISIDRWLSDMHLGEKRS